MDWNSRLIPNARLMLFAFHIGRARLRRSTLEKSFSGLAIRRRLFHGAPANFTASSKQIGIDVTEFNGARYKQFDDLLDGIFCAYLAYYFWYWGEDGCWVVGDLETGYVTLPRCRLSNCPLHANAALVYAAAPE